MSSWSACVSVATIMPVMKQKLSKALENNRVIYLPNLFNVAMLRDKGLQASPSHQLHPRDSLSRALGEA